MPPGGAGICGHTRPAAAGQDGATHTSCSPWPAPGAAAFPAGRQDLEQRADVDGRRPHSRGGAAGEARLLLLRQVRLEQRLSSGAPGEGRQQRLAGERGGGGSGHGSATGEEGWRARAAAGLFGRAAAWSNCGAVRAPCFPWCRSHPNDFGHQVIAELLGSVVAKAVDEEQLAGCQPAGWAEPRNNVELRELPPPMVPGNADAPTTLCAMQVRGSGRRWPACALALLPFAAALPLGLWPCTPAGAGLPACCALPGRRARRPRCVPRAGSVRRC